MKGTLDYTESQMAYDSGYNANPLVGMISIYSANFHDKMMKDGYDYDEATYLMKMYIRGAKAALSEQNLI